MMTIREILLLLESEEIQPPDHVRAAEMDSRLRDVVSALPPVTEWVPLLRSQAWFSPLHFSGNEANAMDFQPNEYVYSPVVDIRTDPTARSAHYRRGVKKYVAALRRGDTLPPITYVWNAHYLKWNMLDGNHRSQAYAETGTSKMPAIFAYPIRALLQR
jgi:hypothetical protein